MHSRHILASDSGDHTCPHPMYRLRDEIFPFNKPSTLTLVDLKAKDISQLNLKGVVMLKLTGFNANFAEDGHQATSFNFLNIGLFSCLSVNIFTTMCRKLVLLIFIVKNLTLI